MNTILLFFSGLAGIGLALSIIVHVAALAGMDLFGHASFGLHIGIFVVWIPAVLVAQRHTRDFKQRDFWKAALRGCPRWMQWSTAGFFGYAIVNFAYFFFTTASGVTEPPGASSPETLRGFSGHWMAFYSAAMSVLYSSTRIAQTDLSRRCLQGHSIGPLAKFCEECGSPAAERSVPPPAA